MSKRHSNVSLQYLCMFRTIPGHTWISFESIPGNASVTFGKRTGHAWMLLRHTSGHISGSGIDNDFVLFMSVMCDVLALFVNVSSRTFVQFRTHDEARVYL